MPKILRMPKPTSSAGAQGNATSKLGQVVPMLPDAEEEQASLHTIEKWIKLADAVLDVEKSRKKA